MNRPPTPSTLAEDMGLRLEDTTRLGLVDLVLVIALVASGAAWVWVSLVGVEPDLVAALRSPAGRLVAAVVGVATVAAGIRDFVVSRWTAMDSDGTLL